MNITQEWGKCAEGGVARLSCIPIVLQNIINFLIIFAGIVAVFLIIYAGIKFIMSEGDPEKVSSARKTLIYAIAGFIFVLMSYVFVNLIGQFTGLQQLIPKK